jgi:hypothetical protein
MSQKRAVSPFAVIGLLGFGAVTMTLVQPTPDASTPPVSPGKHAQSNKGGRLHGLERADQAAGQHGQRGRETAREMQLNRPERSGPSEAPVKPSRSGR